MMSTDLTGSNNPTYKPMDNYINEQYKNLNVFISGLQFVRSTYNQKKKQKYEPLIYVI
jgi:hypothetical protein